MLNNYEFLDDKDVISLSNDQDKLFSLGKTYKVIELSKEIGDVLFHKWNEREQKILEEGIEYEVLRVNQYDGWCKGKIKLQVVFYPDQPEQDVEFESLRQISDSSSHLVCQEMGDLTNVELR